VKGVFDAMHKKEVNLLPLIGLFKLTKAVLLFAVAFGLHRLVLRPDVADALHNWAAVIRVDPDSHFAHTLIAKVTGVPRSRLHELGIGTFLYGVMFGVEGIGLVMKKRWAEYVAIFSTTAFLPLEIYELLLRLTMVKGIVFILNVLIVVYLAWQLARSRRRERSTESPAILPIDTSTDRPSSAT
jgi:uncharacterized membrane protein (DUF2068 family)